MRKCEDQSFQGPKERRWAPAAVPFTGADEVGLIGSPGRWDSFLDRSGRHREMRRRGPTGGARRTAIVHRSRDSVYPRELAEGGKMILAQRTRKARRSSRCPLCRGPVLIGQYIARLGLTWVHSTCAVARM